MKTSKQIKWRPVSHKFNSEVYEEFTLVKVKEWKQRYGFGVHIHGSEWSVRPDPAIPDEKQNITITHWLAVPKIQE